MSHRVNQILGQLNPAVGSFASPVEAQPTKAGASHFGKNDNDVCNHETHKIHYSLE